MLFTWVECSVIIQGSNLLSQSIFSRFPGKFCLFSSCLSLILQVAFFKMSQRKTTYHAVLNHYRIDCNRPAGARPTIKHLPWRGLLQCAE